MAVPQTTTNLKSANGLALFFREVKNEMKKVTCFGEHPCLLATLAKDITHNEEEALLEIYKKLRPGEPANLENAQQLIKNTFSDSRRYDLANVGRYKVNKKMNWRRRLFGKELMEPICQRDEDGQKGHAKTS